MEEACEVHASSICGDEESHVVVPDESAALLVMSGTSEKDVVDGVVDGTPSRAVASEFISGIGVKSFRVFRAKGVARSNPEACG